jgi:hypothetical protein
LAELINAIVNAVINLGWLGTIGVIFIASIVLFGIWSFKRRYDGEKKLVERLAVEGEQRTEYLIRLAESTEDTQSQIKDMIVETNHTVKDLQTEVRTVIVYALEKNRGAYDE